MSNPEQPTAVVQAMSDNLYREIFGVGHRIAMRVNDDFHAAEDAAQEAALMLWQLQERAARYKKGKIAHPLDFALRAAYNAAEDERERRTQAPNINSDVVESVLANLQSDALETVDAHDAVMRAIRTRNYRRTSDIRIKIFQLTLANFGPPQVAELLGIETANVQWHLDRGKERIREELGL